MKEVKLMADYECSPLWYASDEQVNNIALDALPISDFLKQKLKVWAKQYDATLNRDDPFSSGFSNSEFEKKFREEGICLKEKLQQELGAEYEVLYQE